jgi:hypothetical protein
LTVFGENNLALLATRSARQRDQFDETNFKAAARQLTASVENLIISFISE